MKCVSGQAGLAWAQQHLLRKRLRRCCRGLRRGRDGRVHGWGGDVRMRGVPLWGSGGRRGGLQGERHPLRAREIQNPWINPKPLENP